MPTRDDFVIARESGVTLYWSDDGTTFTALGCPKGTWTFGETIAEVEDNIDNWCSAAETAIASFSPGATTITISGAMEMILDDAAYLAMKAKARAKTLGYMRYTATDVAADDTETETFSGYLTTFTRNFQGSGPSDVSVTFRANTIVGAS